jgi:hypothetical protein
MFLNFDSDTSLLLSTLSEKNYRLTRKASSYKGIACLGTQVLTTMHNPKCNSQLSIRPCVHPTAIHPKVHTFLQLSVFWK